MNTISQESYVNPLWDSSPEETEMENPLFDATPDETRWQRIQRLGHNIRGINFRDLVPNPRNCIPGAATAVTLFSQFAYASVSEMIATSQAGLPGMYSFQGAFQWIQRRHGNAMLSELGIQAYLSSLSLWATSSATPVVVGALALSVFHLSHRDMNQAVSPLMQLARLQYEAGSLTHQYFYPDSCLAPTDPWDDFRESNEALHELVKRILTIQQVGVTNI